MINSNVRAMLAQPVDLAAFAQLCWWEGEGADLQLRRVEPDAQGLLLPHYDAQSDEWHLGLEWEMPRDLRRVVVRFPDAAHVPAKAIP